MNTKPLLYLSCLFATTLTTSSVNAGPHRGGGHHVASVPARGAMARPFVGGSSRIGAWNGQRWSGRHFVGSQRFSGQRFNGQRWNGSHWGNNWNWHHHNNNNNVVFISGFGFPFWGWWGWGYPYSYGYYPYGYYPYGYGSGYYGSYYYNYGNGYGYDNGSGYTGQYDAKVAELQRRLKNAGYYRGEIDGIFGSRTQYALKAYRHDHPSGNNNYGGSPTLRDHPYSPPPITTEPSPTY